jgi:Type VIII secretion system (T8SS), CsgF protein
LRRLILPLLLVSSTAHAGELVQAFKDPTFSGVGYPSQALTVAQMEITAKQTIANNKASSDAAAAAAAASTPLAKFMSLFTSQVYAQLATQLSNNLFSTNGPSSNAGTFNLDGNTISYVKTGTMIQLNVVDQNGNVTQLTVPIASFAF